MAQRDFKHSFKTSRQETLPLLVYNVGFQKCPPLYGWGPGVRDHYLIHYVVSGRGRLELEGRTFELRQGDAFLIPPDTTVYYRADGTDPWEYYWVGFDGASAALLLARTPLSRRTPVAALGDGRLRQALLDIYKARGSDYPSAVRMAGYLQAALGLLMESAPPKGEAALTAYARQGAEFLQQNYSRPIGVEDAAAAVGVSRSTLYRAFQTEFHRSPSAYLTGYRIQRACQLLESSALPVGAVATSVGYEDHLYFSRAFRRELGCTPTEYRRNRG